MNDWRQYRELENHEFITVGVDTSSGAGDYTTACFISKTRIDVPLVYRSKKTATELTNQLVTMLEKIYDTTNKKPIVAYERNNGGSFELDRLAALNRLNKYDIFKMPNFGRLDPPESVKYGWSTNTATRPKMLQDLKNAVDNKVLKIYDEDIINEMYSFIVMQTSSSWKAQAEKYAHDDLIFGLGIAWQLYNQAIEPDDTIDSELPDERELNKAWY